MASIKITKEQYEKHRESRKRTPQQEKQFREMVEKSQAKRRKKKDETWRQYRARIGEEEVLRECTQKPKGKYAYISPLEEILGAHEPSKAEAEAELRIQHFVRS